MPTQRPKIKGFKSDVKNNEVVWSSALVRAVYLESTLELQRLKESKRNEAFELIPASIVTYSLSL